MIPDDRKPRIAVIVPALAEGGGVPAVARFVKNTILRSNRFDFRMVSLATSASDPCHSRIVRPWSLIRGPRSCGGSWDGTPFVHVGAVAGDLEFQRYRPRAELRRAIEDCDIYQVVCGSPAWACAVCGLGKPVSVQCATRASVERRRQQAGARGLLHWWRRRMTRRTNELDDMALRSADAIQVENPWMLEYSQGLNKHRAVDLRYAPPGIDTHRFSPAAERGTISTAPVLCVGRLDDPRKNVDLILDACSRIRADQRRTLRVILAGQSGPPPAFWAKATAMGLREQIEFVHRPTEDEVIALYRNAGVFVLPSDEEGLGLVLLEAMACGVPVVSTRSGGPEGVITDGSDGFLVDRDDADALADRIERLRTNETLNRDMGGRARRTMESRFSEEITGEVFLQVWDGLLRRAGRN